MADRRTESRRGLLFVLALLVFLVVAVDLLGSDSVILGYVRDMGGPGGTPLQRLLDRIGP